MPEHSELSALSSESALIFALNEAVANIGNTEALFRLILEMLRPVFHIELCVIQLISEDPNFLEIFEPAVLAPDELLRARAGDVHKTRISKSEFADILDMESRDIVRHVVKDLYSANSEWPDVRVMFERLHLEELVFCPLLYSGKIIGHLLLITKTVNHIQDKDMPLLRQVTRVIASAVVNTTSYEKLARRERDAELVLQFTADLMDRRNLDGFLLPLAASLQKLRSFQFFSVMGLQSEDDDIQCASFDGVAWQYSASAAVPWVGPDATQGDSQAQIHYMGGDVLAKAFPKPDPVADVLKRHAIVAAVQMRLDLEEFPPVTLFLGAKDLEAEELLVAGVFEQAAPQLLLALRSMMNWERTQYLQRRLQQENRALYEEISTRGNQAPMLGESVTFRRILSRSRQVASTDSTVLLLGETGTGKELMARYIHAQSKRRDKPMVKVNCASLPAQLIESELFGHERGAFTGALERRIGKFELADGGTIFLDEIGELALESQAKLLRVLQENELERLGGRSIIKINVRVIAATNRDLQKESRQGRFRTDLFYRLNVFPLVIPPLRERREDVPLLAEMFLQRFAKRFGRSLRPLNHEELEMLKAYPWPGNVQELEHLMERAVIAARDGNPNLRELRDGGGDAGPVEATIQARPLDDIIREEIIKALRQTNGRVSGPQGAAQILGLNDKTLDTRMRRYGIRRKAEFS
ncbi:MAG TPA: sigma 54-interacting transcriptional regulator [Fibrobacteraceae bacterium]|nr:sigma 54-interacting transcriptional regulator [Fibrobacteraceae bacterium]